MERSKNLSIKIANIFNVAKKNKWVAEYNSDLDHFYWAKPKISKNAKLKKFLDDFSLYITPSGEIQGLFIEYAKFNFIAHNEQYEKLFKKMKKVEKDKYVLGPKEEEEVESLLRNMANQVESETLKATGEGLNLNKVLVAT